MRVDAANQLRHDQPARRAVKRAHSLLLLLNLANLAEHETIRLSDVRVANQSLMTAYVMKEQLKAPWNAPTA